MGICHSCDSTAVSTAKVIFHDGKLHEFPHPARVSHVLDKNPNCFVCNSDEMEFNDFLSAISPDEYLQPGQIYFALPLARLKYALQAEEMAALAVMASSALRKSGGSRCGGCLHSTSVVPVSESHRTLSRDGCDGRVGSIQKRKGGVNRRSRSSDFATKLSAIPE